MQKLIKSKLIEIFKLYKLKLGICVLFLTLVLFFGMQRNIIFANFDNYIKNLGFSLKKINITGISKLDEYEIRKHIKYKNCENLFCIDMGGTKKSLEKLAWIKSANLKLILPSELIINIYEEKPSFILDDGKFISLLNSQGKKIETIKSSKNLYENLVIISGDNVVDKINDLNSILNTSPDLAEKITSAKLISNRRWSLVYAYFTTLDLPEKNPENALRKLDSLNKKYGIISGDLKKIDLRIKDRMIIKFNINKFSFSENKV